MLQRILIHSVLLLSLSLSSSFSGVPTATAAALTGETPVSTGTNPLSGGDGSISQAKKSFPWNMFLPAITKPPKAPQSYWRVLTMVTCNPSLTFTVTLDGIVRKSVMLPSDFEGTWSDWAVTTPGNKEFSWQATCGTFTKYGTLNWALKEDMNYRLTLDGTDWNSLHVTVTENPGIPPGVSY